MVIGDEVGASVGCETAVTNIKENYVMVIGDEVGASVGCETAVTNRKENVCDGDW